MSGVCVNGYGFSVFKQSFKAIYYRFAGCDITEGQKGTFGKTVRELDFLVNCHLNGKLRAKSGIHWRKLKMCASCLRQMLTFTHR